MGGRVVCSLVAFAFCHPAGAVVFVVDVSGVVAVVAASTFRGVVGSWPFNGCGGYVVFPAFLSEPGGRVRDVLSFGFFALPMVVPCSEAVKNCWLVAFGVPVPCFERLFFADFAWVACPEAKEHGINFC